MIELAEYLEQHVDIDPQGFVPMMFRGRLAGFVDRAHLRRLRDRTEDFVVRPERVEVVDRGLPYAERSHRLDEAVRAIYDEDSAGFGRWCPESTPVVDRFGGTPMFDLQRAAVGFFGILTCGVHLNVFSVHDRKPHLHLARRAAAIASYPGLLDQAVAGFLPVGGSPADKLVEEAAEEAGLKASAVASAKPAGAIQFMISRNPGLQRGAVFVFDLELEPGHELQNRDGEIDEFLVMSPEDVATAVAAGGFKFDSGLVATDFLLRHGCIDAADRSYLRISSALRADTDWLHRRPRS